MSVQLVSSNSTKRKPNERPTSSCGDVPLSLFLATGGYLSVLVKANAILIDLENKMALKAVFKCFDPKQDSRRLFIPGIYIGSCTADCIRPEIELVTYVARSEDNITTEGRGLYVHDFIRPQDALQFARYGFRKILYSSGRGTSESLGILRRGGVEIIKVNP